MQYATMVDLIEKAKQAGQAEAYEAQDRLGESFDIWLDDRHLGEITEEEEEALRMAFEKAFSRLFYRP